MCVCVWDCHTCYRLLIRREIIYLDVSSATSREAKLSSRQKRPTATDCRRAPGEDQVFYAQYFNLRVFAGHIVTRVHRRRGNYTPHGHGKPFSSSDKLLIHFTNRRNDEIKQKNHIIYIEYKVSWNEFKVLYTYTFRIKFR